jgi:hypothetical protein
MTLEKRLNKLEARSLPLRRMIVVSDRSELDGRVVGSDDTVIVTGVPRSDRLVASACVAICRLG